MSPVDSSVDITSSHRQTGKRYRLTERNNRFKGIKMYKHRELFRIHNPFSSKDHWGSHSLVRIHYTTNGDGKYPGSPKRSILNIKFGNGAGYIWGMDLFFAINIHARSDTWQRMIPSFSPSHRKPFQFGLTRNANKVPYIDG